jgi:hypothetical protein
MTFFADHGTKVLGAMTAMAGTAQLGLTSLETAAVISHPHAVLTDYLLAVLIAGLGGGTIVRGFSNSRNGDSK